MYLKNKNKNKNKNEYLNLKFYLSSQKTRYLIAGIWNTIFGYSCGLLVFYFFSDKTSLVIVGIISNIIGISMSFLTHKIFVFKTKGNWIGEYFRAFVVYGLSALLGIALLVIMVDGFGLKFWLAQGIVVLALIALSFLGHKYFTFKSGPN